jgi:hypothetical protein
MNASRRECGCEETTLGQSVCFGELRGSVSRNAKVGGQGKR